MGYYVETITKKMLTSIEQFAVSARPTFAENVVKQVVSTIIAFSNLARYANSVTAHDGERYFVSEYAAPSAVSALFVPRMVTIDASDDDALDLSIHETIEPEDVLTPEEFREFFYRLGNKFRTKVAVQPIEKLVGIETLTPSTPVVLNGRVRCDLSSIKRIPVYMNTALSLYDEGSYSVQYERVVAVVVERCLLELAERKAGVKSNEGNSNQ